MWGKEADEVSYVCDLMKKHDKNWQLAWFIYLVYSFIKEFLYK